MIKDKLKNGFYYWVINEDLEIMIAQYEGDYWLTDVTIPLDEFSKNLKVLEEVALPKEYKGNIVI